MRVVLFLVVTISLGNCAPNVFSLQYKNLFQNSINHVESNPNPRIIGGSEVEPHSIPFQVFLEMHTATSAWYCGGSIISKNYILTAAHCGVGVVEARVYLGRHDLTKAEPGSEFVISNEVTVHPEYDAQLIHNDIAVVKLPNPLTFSDTIQAVKIPSKAQADDSFSGERARISGWGRTDGFVGGISTTLQSVYVKVITNEECGRDFNILDNNICTSGDQMTGSCSGDSGGPLVVDDVQVGVVSFGIVSCLPGYPSAFARVSKFLNWIANNTDLIIE